MVRLAFLKRSKQFYFSIHPRAEAVSSKRAKAYELAKRARAQKRDLETKRYLRAVKQCDEEYQRYSVTSFNSS